MVTDALEMSKTTLSRTEINRDLTGFTETISRNRPHFKEVRIVLSINAVVISTNKLETGYSTNSHFSLKPFTSA